MIEAYQRHRDEIASILDTAFYTIEWVDKQIADGVFKVFGSDKAVILTEIRTYPTGVKTIHGLVAAGALDAIKQLIAFAEQYGRDNGCIVAEIESREGWLKTLPGYELYQVAIRKVL
jgi:hypothetical protein